MAEEHTFSSATPAALAALAVSCFGSAAIFFGKVALTSLPCSPHGCLALSSSK